MSMPSFPPNGANITRKEALTMIIASIAMEELALSHILNAEGEKLQYILGTMPGAKPCVSHQDVLAVNKSVTALVEVITQNQMLLKNKLALVLEFCPPPPPCRPEPGPVPCPPPCKPEPGPVPCPPPCKPEPCPVPCPPSCKPEPCPPQCQPEPGPAPCPPPCQPKPKGDSCPQPHLPEGCPFNRWPAVQVQSNEKSALQLVGQREKMGWNPGCRLPWRQRNRIGKSIRWNERTPTQILLDPRKAYAIQYTLNISATCPAGESGTVYLRQSPCGVFTDTMPLHFSADPARGPQTLRYAAVLYPCVNGGWETGLSLVLEAQNSLWVERAVIDVIEL